MPETQTDTTATATNDGLTADPSASPATAAPADAQTQTTTEPESKAEARTESPDAETTGETETKPDGPPERYEFAAPEGQSYTPSVIEAYSEVAKEIGLTQESAQKVLDRVSPAMVAAQQAQLAAAFKQWETDARADQEIGGDKFDANLGIANKALDDLGTPELRGLLKESGLGSHPEVLRFFYRAGKAISEDTRVVTGGQRATPPDPAKRMFPNMN